MNNAVWQLFHSLRIPVINQPFGYFLIILTEYPGKCLLLRERTKIISMYSLSGLGISSNLIGSLSGNNNNYWALFPPWGFNDVWSTQNKMASMNSCFGMSIKSTLNGFHPQMLKTECCWNHFVCLHVSNFCHGLGYFFVSLTAMSFFYYYYFFIF